MHDIYKMNDILGVPLHVTKSMIISEATYSPNSYYKHVTKGFFRHSL